jgi:hypothetical protein
MLTPTKETDMNITVPMLDDFPSEDEEAQDRIRPAIYLPARMLSDAIPRPMARDVKRKRPIVVVIEVQSREWFEVIRPVAQIHFRPADFIAKEEKLVYCRFKDFSRKDALYAYRMRLNTF